MYLISKTYSTGDMKVVNLVKDNPVLLLVLENFGITNFDKEFTVFQLCKKMDINANLFLLICNLHNGFYNDKSTSISTKDLPDIISYLKKGHQYYQTEKYPEIVSYIKQIKKIDNSNILSLIDTYFNEYFEEVKEHIKYEEDVAFPYFLSMVNQNQLETNYTSNKYKEHHNDIESHLNAFRDLLIQHVQLKEQHNIKRKLLISLSELEFELKVHSHIEDTILIPLIKILEEEVSNG
jgi:regulator of cell morphogenesis and NO signaling